MKRGDIHWITVAPTRSHVQSGTRPHVIVQCDAVSHRLPTDVVVPFTTSLNSLQFPSTILIPSSAENGPTRDSVALTFQVFSADKRSLRG